MISEKTSIKRLTFDELKTKLGAMGFKGYRAGQITSWIYRHYAVSFEEMTNIAKAERDRLQMERYKTGNVHNPAKAKAARMILSHRSRALTVR